MDSSVSGKRPALPARPETTFAHSATVNYLSKISQLELVNSELEVQIQVSQADNQRLKEQVKSLRSELAKSRDSEEIVQNLKSKVASLTEEKEDLRTHLNRKQREIEEMGSLFSRVNSYQDKLKETKGELLILQNRFRTKVEEETKSLRTENEELRSELKAIQGHKTKEQSQMIGTSLQKAREKVSNISIKLEDESGTSRRVLTEAEEEILVETVNLAEINEQHSPHEPYSQHELLFASARKPRTVEPSGEDQQRRRSLSTSSAGWKRSLSRVSSTSRMSLVAKYTPSFVRTWRKPKPNDTYSSHINLPKVSEIKLTPQLPPHRIQPDSFAEEFPDETELQ